MKPVKAHKAQSLYLDTSVIGGYFDDEFKDATQELWRQAGKGLYRFMTSVLVEQEIAAAPEQVQKLMSQTFREKESFLPLTEEAVDLAQAYLKHKVVPSSYTDDARHVAIAVVQGVYVMVSWNFKHLVNLRRETGFNSVNLLQGYPAVRILSPLELIYGS